MLLLFLSWLISAQAESLTPWSPFFTPRVSRAEVLALKTVFVGHGGEGDVFAKRHRDGRIVARKSYYFAEAARQGKAALLRMQALEAQGLLGPFHVVPVHRVYNENLYLDLVEGKSLAQLIEESPDDPRVKALYRKYLLGLREVRRNVFADTRPTLTLRKYELGCEEFLSGESRVVSLSNLIVYDGSSEEPKSLKTSRYDVFLEEKMLFSLDPLNVIVEANSGRLVVVDPF